MIALRRKHTSGLNLRVELASAVLRFQEHFGRLAGEVERLKERALPDVQAKGLIHDAFASGLMPLRFLPDVSRAYFEPDLAEFIIASLSKKMIRDRNFDEINGNVKADNFTIKKDRRIEHYARHFEDLSEKSEWIQLELVHFDRVMDTDEVLVKFNEFALRPASIVELLNGYGADGAPALWGLLPNQRILYLEWVSNDWQRNHPFAAVEQHLSYVLRSCARAGSALLDTCSLAALYDRSLDGLLLARAKVRAGELLASIGRTESSASSFPRRAGIAGFFCQPFSALNLPIGQA